jgi:hypothetical protein
MIGQCIRKSHVSRHVGRDLDNISRGLPNKIPVHIAEGKLRPEVPLQAAKLASEAGIILRNHVPIFTHWKQYKDEDAIGVVKDFNDKVSVSKLVAKHMGVPCSACCLINLVIESGCNLDQKACLWITKYIPGW